MPQTVRDEQSAGGMALPREYRGAVLIAAMRCPRTAMRRCSSARAQVSDLCCGCRISGIRQCAVMLMRASTFDQLPHGCRHECSAGRRHHAPAPFSSVMDTMRTTLPCECCEGYSQTMTPGPGRTPNRKAKPRPSCATNPRARDLRIRRCCRTPLIARAAAAVAGDCRGRVFASDVCSRSRQQLSHDIQCVPLYAAQKTTGHGRRVASR